MKYIMKKKILIITSFYYDSKRDVFSRMKNRETVKYTTETIKKNVILYSTSYILPSAIKTYRRISFALFNFNMHTVE